MDSEPPVFPVSVKVAAAAIDNTHTDVAVLGFSNCIVILVTQLSSVGSLVQCVVSQLADTTLVDPQHMADQLREASVPVDVKFLLGNPGACAASSLYQILATATSQRKHEQNPSDVRPVILGIGLDLPRAYKVSSMDDGMPDLGAFSSTMNALALLVDECRVW
ncbi:hypothetical protein IWW56_002761 [Coemansia sp. RSA 2131]|nr:hypothetical protein IWW56_002761 [Coemansia sp. RSA 2131]